MAFSNFKQVISKLFSSDTDLQPNERSLLRKVERLNKCGREITPELYQQVRDYEVAWLERHYDFNSVEGINSIPNERNLPKPPRSGVTGQVEYYLLHKAAELESSDPDLAIACYKKANQLMCLSNTVYDKNYFLRLPRFLRKIRRFDDARAEEAIIAEMFPSPAAVDVHKEIDVQRAKLLSNARKTEYNLIEADYVRCVCSECAKYRERVYCIAGENKKYPTLPDHLLDPTHDCGITLTPVIENVHSLHTRDGRELCGTALILYSNRPFIDDRPRAEIKDYKTQIAEDLAEEEAVKKAEIASAEYDWLWEYHPEVCPKSLSGYKRMKNQNTANFQKIKAIALTDKYIIT